MFPLPAILLGYISCQLSLRGCSRVGGDLLQDAASVSVAGVSGPHTWRALETFLSLLSIVTFCRMRLYTVENFVVPTLVCMSSCSSIARFFSSSNSPGERKEGRKVGDEDLPMCGSRMESSSAIR